MAKKLTLKDLHVDSFEAGAPQEERGTVRGLEDVTPNGACCTHLQTGCNPDITSIYTGQCCPA